MICQNIPDNLILSEVTVLNEAKYFDVQSNNVSEKVVLADINKLLISETYGVLLISPSHKAKY